MKNTVKKIFVLILTVLLTTAQVAFVYAAEEDRVDTLFTAEDLLDENITDEELTDEELSDVDSDNKDSNAHIIEDNTTLPEPEDSQPSEPDEETDSETEINPEDTENLEITIDNPITLDISAQPLTVAEENTVSTEAELKNWLLEHLETGGTVILGNSITVTRSFLVQSSSSITVDTNMHGLVFDGGSISLDQYFGGQLMFTGEGVNTPVIQVKSLGRIFTGDRNNCLYKLNITATGKEGVGGTALSISGSGKGTYNDVEILYYPPGKIRSYGTGAIGIEFTDWFNACCFDIEVEGEDSTAVSAPEGALLSFCKLEASGANAVSVRGNNVYADTCIAQPNPEGSGIRSYTRVTEPAFMMIKQNSSLEDLKYMLRYNKYTPLTGGEVRSAIAGFITKWDESVYGAVDFSVTGKTTVPGKISNYYSPFWISQFIDITENAKMVIEVRDPDIPSIYETEYTDFLNDLEEEFVELRLWQSEKWALDECSLLRSDDGKTWYDYSDDENVIWEEGYDGYNSVYLTMSAISDGCMVLVDVPNVGESNVIQFSYADGQPIDDRGGDRTGADRIIGIKPGPHRKNDGGNPDDDDDDNENPDDNHNPGGNDNSGRDNTDNGNDNNRNLGGRKTGTDTITNTTGENPGSSQNQEVDDNLGNSGNYGGNMENESVGDNDSLENNIYNTDRTENPGNTANLNNINSEKRGIPLGNNLIHVGLNNDEIPDESLALTQVAIVNLPTAPLINSEDNNTTANTIPGLKQPAFRQPDQPSPSRQAETGVAIPIAVCAFVLFAGGYAFLRLRFRGNA